MPAGSDASNMPPRTRSADGGWASATANRLAAHAARTAPERSDEAWRINRKSVFPDSEARYAIASHDLLRNSSSAQTMRLNSPHTARRVRAAQARTNVRCIWRIGVPGPPSAWRQPTPSGIACPSGRACDRPRCACPSIASRAPASRDPSARWTTSDNP